MAVSPTKLVHSLILDAGPILKNEPPVSTLLGLSENIWTVPAVIEEIRDVNARSRVKTTLLPFLKLRTPTPSSIKSIIDFARRTGDLEVLSRPDIQVLALAYELECERNHGDWRLRSMPCQGRINGSPPAGLECLLYLPAPTAAPECSSEEKPVPEMASGTVLPTLQPILPKAEGGIALGAYRDLTPDNLIERLDIETAEEASPDVEILSSASEESDNGGWITPSNIKMRKEKDATKILEQQLKLMQVATITTDFAMQNVLLRMNLNLLSLSLQKIHQLKTWVLRCHACFNITKDMSKQFCSRCGKPSLLRTSCSTDRDGNFRVHLKKNMQWNTRGNVYSIPKPVPGSASGKVASGGGKGGWGQVLILAEDQKEYVRAMMDASRRKEKDLMDEDYLPSILSGNRGKAGGMVKVGAGKNVNSKKRS